MKLGMLLGLAIFAVGCGGAPFEPGAERVGAPESDAGAPDGAGAGEAAPDAPAGQDGAGNDGGSAAEASVSCEGTALDGGPVLCCYAPLIAGCQGPMPDGFWVVACCPPGATQCRAPWTGNVLNTGKCE